MRDLPGLFDVRVKARSLAYLFATGASLGLLTLVFPHSEEVRDVPLIILAASAYVIAAIVWLIADRLRDWHIHAVLASGTAIIGLANYYAGPGTLYPILYTWTALYAFYFFPIREAAAQMVFLGASYAIVLAVEDADMVVVRWLLAVGTPLVAGLLISQLLRPAPAPGEQAASVRGAHAAGARHRPRRVHHARQRRPHHHLERGGRAALRLE